MPIQPQWQDRRGMFQRGREMHEPSTASQRRASEASLTEGLAKTTTNQSNASSASSASLESPVMNYNPHWGIEHRRRSSAASSSSSGMFANLLSHKRGSEDYQTRRSSFAEMEGKSGVLGGLWNSTFRGIQSAKDVTVEKAKEAKKGIME